jgi:glycerol-3-phosphate dehydrogenase
MALTVTDLLIRRTGTFFWSPDGGAAAIDQISGHMAAAVGYAETERQRQVDAYLAWVRRNRLTTEAA